MTSSMETKVLVYSELARQTTQDIVHNHRTWTDYLTTAARLYKYDYIDQLLIYAQRPDATACAEYALWNNTMGRYVRRGSKGIALLDMSSDEPRLRYVFDVSDTGAREKSREVYLWQLETRHDQAVSDMLVREYGCPANLTIADQLEHIAGELAERYWQEHQQDVRDIVDGSLLSQYDDDNLHMAFRGAVTVSTAYTLQSRCGLQPQSRFTQEDFQQVFDWNTPSAVHVLGSAIAQASGEVLRNIEKTVKEFERSVTYDRDQLPESRRLPDSQHSRAGNDGNVIPFPEQIREAAEEVPERAAPAAVQQYGAERDTDGASAGDRRDGEPPDRADHDRAGEGSRRDGGTESVRSAAVDGADEQPQSASGGNRSDGVGVQLSFLDGLFLSEAEQIAAIDQAESVITPSAFSVRPEMIDLVLRMGNDGENTRMQIMLAFMRDKSLDEIADLLKELYGGSNGFDMDGQRVCAWYAENGIHLTQGKSARYDRMAQVLTWRDAAERIGQMIAEGRYGTVLEQAAAPEQDRRRVANALLNLYHDFSTEAQERGLLSLIGGLNEGGYPEATARIAQALTDPDYLQAVAMQYEFFLDAHKENHDLLRFHYHRLDQIRVNLNALALPLRELPPQMEALPDAQQFITEDDINDALTRGGAVEGSKGRIFGFFSDEHTRKEKVDFLKTEYGQSGMYQGRTKGYIGGKSFGSKGATFEKDDCEKIHLTWNEVTKRIETLIRQDRYLTPEEKARWEDRMEQASMDADEPLSEPQQSNGISEKDIEEAVRRSFSPEQKREIVRYLQEYRGEENLEDWLSHFDGGDPSKLYHVMKTGTDEDITLSWAHRLEVIEHLIDTDRFFTDEEIDQMEDIDSSYIRTELEKRGIVDGQVIDGQALVADPFIQQVEADADAVAWEEQQPINHESATPIENEANAPEITEAQTENQRQAEPSDGHNGWIVYPAVKNGLPYDIVIKPLNGDEYVRESPEEQKPKNFRITDDHLGEGGAKTKYGFNIAAIRTLRQIEEEGRSATPDEQEILSRYVGWGGIPQAFDGQNESWSKEYTELKALLSPQEYDAARASSLNAHYTSPTVIRAIYEAIERMGFVSGNILEPSCGIGNFFGMLPESMSASRMYGVELDNVTGRIAQQLYPQAKITVTGFENTQQKDFYDLAVGNVPFGSYKIADRQYDRYNFHVHDYFFAKSLDQVRPGGVIAFITSKGTLDKQNPDVRRYIAQRAELLGAVRLPNNAFKANANTEVTTDILFLQKREQPMVVEPEWVHLGQTEDGIPINSYFVAHPEMVLGRMAWDDRMHGNEKETSCLPIEGADLQEQLTAAMQNIHGQYREAELPELAEGEDIQETIPADPNVKNFSYTIVEGEVYYRENSIMVRPDLNVTAKERIKGMVALRDCTRALLDAQLNNESDDVIHQYQHELNNLYDRFTAKYGLISSRANSHVFKDDSSYYLLCSLEVLDEEGKLARKADMFTMRTVKQQRVVEHVDTASEALALSIGEHARVDLPYMAKLTGMSEEQIVRDLTGVIYRDHLSPPDNPNYLTADAYLSGNVREKLNAARLAAVLDPSLEANVQALESVQPKDLDASEIDVRLGATWIKVEYIQQFMEELLHPSFRIRDNIRVLYSEQTGEWNITAKGQVSHNDVAAYTTYGTQRVNAYKILEDSLNLRDVRVYDTIDEPDGGTKRILNQKETTIAQQKQQAIKDAFRDWIWKDPNRRRALTETYNTRFNAIRPREYDGQHLILSGMSPEITLREHQRNAIAHILYGGNTLLAHEVGAGKTFEMVAAAMESKRLGLCQKSMFVVPNHLTEQWASEFLRLYPNANILVTTKADFETRNRQKFCAKIATGDYDAIIIGHSQFERIPISYERQRRLLQDQIDDIIDGIAVLKATNGERFTIKQMEASKKSLEARLRKLTETGKADDVVTFEQLGVDRLFVDEAHAYKNLFLYTKMRNVAGLSTSEAQKSSDMYLKCRYMDELTGGKGVVFATGTPVSNSMTELYTMQRYLQFDALQWSGLGHFDSWAALFGETTTAIELAPEGTGYRARTRFAKFFNLPELMTMFKEVADVKTADQLHLPRPEAHYETIVAEPSEEQRDMVQALSERAAAVHAGSVEPTKDNMLKITSDGRKLGLDQRLINPLLPDHPGSKVNLCVENIHRIWQEGAEERLTQLVFCDISTPKGAPTEAGEPGQPDLDNFNVYDDIRNKLIAKGLPPEEIVFIHTADTEAKKKELFSAVRSGKVRVLMGSTAKMGAGTNVQDRLIALHDLDCPWRPGDLEQRAGRIVRQGNSNPDVYIYRYVTQGTFDSYLWQTVENKQKFISQIMTSKSPVRACDDVDETALSYAEIKALCAGDDRIREKMDLDVEVARLRLMKATHQSQQYRLEDQLRWDFPQQIESAKRLLAGLQQDSSTLAAHPLPEKDFIGMEVKGQHLADKETAGKAILDACRDVRGADSVEIGQYRGLSMSVSYDSFRNKFELRLHGEAYHKVELGTDPKGNILRIDNTLEKLPERIRETQERLDSLHQQQEVARGEVGKPFPQEAELKQKSERLAVLNAELDMDSGYGSEKEGKESVQQDRPLPPQHRGNEQAI